MSEVARILCDPDRRMALKKIVRLAPMHKQEVMERCRDAYGLSVIELHHVHLPQLESIDAIRVKDDGTVVCDGGMIRAMVISTALDEFDDETRQATQRVGG